MTDSTPIATEPTESTPPPAQTPQALIKALQAQFAVFRDYLPLAIGIDKQIRERLPEVNRKTLRTALGMHAKSFRYLKGMEKATQRFDLDGNSVADVSEEHRTHAKDTLRERARKRAEQQKAEREAQQAAARTAAKLQQLADTFGRH